VEREVWASEHFLDELENGSRSPTLPSHSKLAEALAGHRADRPLGNAIVHHPEKTLSFQAENHYLYQLGVELMELYQKNSKHLKIHQNIFLLYQLSSNMTFV